jgi:threonine dehydrogenase-like Zn-dependent dehydrogenase
MQAITIEPGRPGTLRLEPRPTPEHNPRHLTVRALRIGICGTDREIAAGRYGAAPAGASRLVLGHEALGRVTWAPADSGFAPGELVAGVVRRPDPEPCEACAAGEWDMCRNGRYTERGIRGRDGYGAETFHLDPAFAVRCPPHLGLCGVLIEPASVVAKAWDHIARIGARTRSWRARRVLVAGAGPVGLLAAMMSRQRDLETHVADRVATGAKPALAEALGATYHADGAAAVDRLAADVVIECTGADEVVLAVLNRRGPDAIVCLTGVSSGGRRLAFDVGGFNRETVLTNDVVFGSVNANRAHYEAAVTSLAQADPAWLARLITRRVPLERWPEAFESRPDDVKVVLEFAEATA